MADPGTGGIRFNSATWASVTAIAIDDNSADTGNPDVSATVLSWDDSTNTTDALIIGTDTLADLNAVLAAAKVEAEAMLAQVTGGTS